MRLFAIYLLLGASLFAQATKVGGTGATLVGGSGATLVTAPPTYVLQDDYETTVAAQLKVGSASGTQHVASYIDIGREGGTAPYNYTKIVLKLRKVGTPTFNISVSTRVNTANLPSSSITVSSAAIAATTLSTSFADVTFLVASTASGAQGTITWVAIDTTGFVDTNNCIEWQNTSNVPFDNFARTYSRTSADGTTWAGGDNTMRAMAIYSTP